MSQPSFAQLVPDAYRLVSALEGFIGSCGLERSLVELVKMRASQINGCAFCLDMHSKAARQEGESEQRLYVLDAWRDAPFYSDRERAALALTERLTRLPVEGAASDAVQRLFSPVEIAHLTLLIGLINLWNRLSIGGGFRLAEAAA